MLAFICVNPIHLHSSAVKPQPDLRHLTEGPQIAPTFAVHEVGTG